MDEILAVLKDVRHNQTDIIHRLDELESQVAASDERIVARFRLFDRKLSGSAAKEVLRIPELVEKILLSLQPHKSLQLQVQSHFKTVTDGSPALQRKLFLKADTTIASSEVFLSPFFFGDGEKDELGYHCKEAFFNQLEPVLTYQKVAADGRTRTPQFTLRANPTASLVPTPKFPLKLLRTSIDADGKLVLHLREEKVERRRALGVSSEEEKRQNWGAMHLVQPPQDIVWRVAREYIEGVIPVGTTAGELLAEGEKLLRRRV